MRASTALSVVGLSDVVTDKDRCVNRRGCPVVLRSGYYDIRYDGSPGLPQSRCERRNYAIAG